MFLTKRETPAQERERRRLAEETLRKDLEVQIAYKKKIKEQEKAAQITYMKQLEADAKAYKEEEVQKKQDRIRRAQEEQLLITQQIERATQRRQQEAELRKTGPTIKGRHVSEPLELLEEPVLSTLGATVRLTPVYPPGHSTKRQSLRHTVK